MPKQHAAGYTFFVDDKKFESPDKVISGAKIKEIAGVNPAFQLFLEAHGEDKPDEAIANDQSVDLSLPGVEKFYAVPPATFGSNE